ESSQNGLAEGVHEVQMLGRIPGLPGVVLESDVVEVLLECETDETGEVATEDTGEQPDETGSFGPFLPADDDPQTCACASADRQARPLGWLLLVLGVALRRPTGRRRGC
ncbi:MAG TPA: hypothetical protein VK034_22970, partial [Enhygromyxa sp.]|nr:hypothetical protein [Enhygromyxa sp.]